MVRGRSETPLGCGYKNKVGGRGESELERKEQRLKGWRVVGGNDKQL